MLTCLPRVSYLSESESESPSFANHTSWLGDTGAKTHKQPECTPSSEIVHCTCRDIADVTLCIGPHWGASMKIKYLSLALASSPWHLPWWGFAIELCRRAGRSITGLKHVVIDFR